VKRQLAVVIAHRDGGKKNIARQILNTAPQISETVRNRTHVHINFFFLRMTNTVTSQNIGLSSWDTLHSMKTEVRVSPETLSMFNIHVLHLIGNAKRNCSLLFIVVVVVVVVIVIAIAI
jgi:hypothetical protein